MKSIIFLIAAVSAATAMSVFTDTNQTNKEPPISAKTIKFIDGIGTDIKTFLHDNKLIDGNTSN